MIFNAKKMISTRESYFIPEGRVTSTLELKKSVFVADMTKIKNKAEVVDFINLAKRTYHKAQHYCWAYIIGDPRSPDCIGISDDGEPRGSAGRPIINVLNQRKVGFAVVVVARYFGGIKLGIGRLRRTYSRITTVVIEKMPLRIFSIHKTVLVSVPYSYHEFFLYIADKKGVSIQTIQYGESIIFEVSLEESICRDFIHDIRTKSSGQIVLKRKTKVVYN